MENIKNYSNIAFCKYIVFFLGLIFNFLQNKEFSKNINSLNLRATKLIPKGSLYFSKSKIYNPIAPLTLVLAAAICLLELPLAPLFYSLASSLPSNLWLGEASAAGPMLFAATTANAGSLNVTPAQQKKLFLPSATSKLINLQSLPAERTASAATSKELKPLLFQYLIEKNNQNGIGLDLKNKKLLNYNFNNRNWFLSEDLIKLLIAFFKSIYCLISKPKFINTPDKIIIEILYYITIPQNNIFKWYNFIYNTKKVIAFNYINALNGQAGNLSSNQLILNKINKGEAAHKLTNNNLIHLNAEINRVKIKKINVQKRNRLIKIILKKKFLIKKTLFNLNKTNITNLYLNKFLILFKLLNSYFKKPIEFNLIRLHKSDYDSNILAQLFFLILKKKNIKAAISKLYFKNKIGMILEGKDINLVGANKKNLAKFIPAYISGLYIHIGGRLLKERIVPKRTTKKFEKGAIATGKINFLDSARITKKNKKGAFTIKIAYAQNFRFESKN